MEAIILAGGLGTRLQQTVPGVPKALAPILGIPFLKILLQQLDESRFFSKVILALGHRAQQIEEAITPIYSFKLVYSVETDPLGTGGAILHALPRIEGETFFVCNGDSYSDISFASFYAFHKTKKGELSLVCRELEDTSRYGSILFDEELRVLQFNEKSSAIAKGWISCGMYLFEKKIFAPFKQSCSSLEKDLFPHFLSHKIFAYPHTGSFIDIGTKDSYEMAQEYLKPQAFHL